MTPIQTLGGLTSTELNNAIARSFVLSKPGSLSVGTGTARLPLPFSGTIKGVTSSIGVAANAAVTVDVNKNGGTIFADANDRPSVAAGQHQSAESAASVAFAAGDYLTVDIDAVGGAAPPTFQAQSYLQVTATPWSVTLNRPTGAATGDVHVAFFNVGVGGTIGSTTEPATVVTTPTGWTRIGTGGVRAVHNTSDRDRELHLFWWRDDGTQATWTFGVTTPTTNSYPAVTVASYRGVLPSGSPVDVFATDSPAAGTSTIPSVTTTAAGALLVAIVAAQEDITNTPALSGGMTARTPTGVRNLVGDQVQAVAGVSGTRSAAGTTWVSGIRGVTGMVALKPDPAAALPGGDLTVVVRYA